MHYSDAVMKRTTVSVPDDLLTRARRIAKARGVSLGEVYRHALRDYLDGAKAWDPPRSLGAGDSKGAARGREIGELPADAYERG
jgi:predicted transcriptional regulator